MALSVLEVWTGDFVFDRERQSFRTKKDQSLELTTASREVDKDKKRGKIALKVVDTFGNDTMTWRWAGADRELPALRASGLAAVFRVAVQASDGRFAVK